MRAAVAVLGGHHHLGGFFADLLEDAVRALGKQARHVALVGVAAAARFDDGGQAGQVIGGSGHLR
jgi:hypothetical protein